MATAPLKNEVQYVTLDINGDGSVRFIARKALIQTVVQKVTIDMPITSSGQVTLSKVGTFLSQVQIATKLEAYGDQPLFTSEYIDVDINAGPTSTVVMVTFFYSEEPESLIVPGRMKTLQFQETPQIVTGTLVVKRTGDVLASAATYGPFFVGGMPYLRVYSESAVRARVQIQWFVDEAATLGLGTDAQVTPGGNNSCRQNWPVRGAWVKFVVDQAAYPNNIILEAYLTSEATSDNTGSNGTNHLIAVDGVNVGIGATSTNDATSTRGGPGYWNAGFDGAAAAGLIRLYMVNFTGGTTLLDVMGTPDMATNGGGRSIQIPAMPLRIVAFNGGAAARNLYAVAHYRLPPL